MANQTLNSSSQSICFFHKNSLSSRSVIKVFYSNLQANIRIFYWKYLKNCLCLETDHFNTYLNDITNI